jgi:2-(1,2-epoxy-1,2-dihydrophenyl)acetyl-CoA isomerase
MLSAMQTIGDITITIGDDHVAVVEIHRAPNNFFSLRMLHDIGKAFDWAAENGGRSVLFCAEGKNFCGGADFSPSGGRNQPDDPELAGRHIYDEAVVLFSCPIPVVAAVQGAAVGGGLGLACMADFRFGTPNTRMTANFARLGFHQGFGLSQTLPEIVGKQRAMELLYTGRRITGEQAAEIGLIDHLVADEADLRAEAHKLAAEIAGSAPLAVRSIKNTLRGHLPTSIREITSHERIEQDRLQKTNDWKEGVKAMAERRDPNFTAS